MTHSQNIGDPNLTFVGGFRTTGLQGMPSASLRSTLTNRLLRYHTFCRKLFVSDWVSGVKLLASSSGLSWPVMSYALPPSSRR
jgi:hypothetical protein